MYLWQLEAEVAKIKKRRRIILCPDEEMATKVESLVADYGVAALYKIRVNPMVPPDELWVIRTDFWDSI